MFGLPIAALVGIFGVAFVLMVAIGLWGSTNNALGTPDPSATSGTPLASTNCGTGVESLLPGFPMLPALKGKLGHEDHLDNTKPTHYCGKDSGNCSTVVHTGFVNPHTTDQERWYFNAQWGGWLNDGQAFDTKKGSAQARSLVKHAKLILTSTETKKSIVVSAEEFGPGIAVTNCTGSYSRSCGVRYGAPPEVYQYLGTSEPGTGKANDGKGEITVAFAQDQKNTQLGPCK